MTRRGLAWTPAAATGAAATVAVCAAGLWLRAMNAPLWPSAFTDWSVGSALLSLSSAAVGAIVLARLRHSVMGRLFLTIGLLTAAVLTTRELATYGLAVAPQATWVPWSAWVCSVVIPVNMTLLTLVMLLFPHGTVLSRRWRTAVAAVAVGGVVACVTTAVAPFGDGVTPFPQVANPLAVLGSDALLRMAYDVLTLGQLLGVVGLVARLRGTSGTERLQVKWFCFAGIVAVVTLVAGFWYQPLFVVATLVALPAVPMAAGMAVLRYRLYDIDRIISRTVAYGAVTAVLAGVYVSGIAVLRFATDPLTGDSAFAVAVSTLAAAAAFRPVTARVRDTVDRRFDRMRYDAVATVEQLRQRCRDEVDLEAITVELIRTVRATMAPACTALWLRETRR